jgi:hypothetical protein
LRSKSCREHVQKIPKGCITDFDSSSFFPVVNLCWKLQSKWLNVDVSQRLKCATMKTYILYCMYSRACFLHCFSCSVYYIGKSWEFLSSTCGSLSGVWSLALQLQKLPWGVLGLWQTLVFDAFFCFPEAFLTHQRQNKTHAALFFALGAWGTCFFLPLVFLGIYIYNSYIYIVCVGITQLASDFIVSFSCLISHPEDGWCSKFTSIFFGWLETNHQLYSTEQLVNLEMDVYLDGTWD